MPKRFLLQPNDHPRQPTHLERFQPVGGAPPPLQRPHHQRCQPKPPLEVQRSHLQRAEEARLGERHRRQTRKLPREGSVSAQRLPSPVSDMVAYEEIKAVRPQTKIIFTSLILGASGFWFIYHAFEMGVKHYCDALAIHFYNEYSKVWLNGIVDLSLGKPLWITEFGASSLTYGLQGQARRVQSLWKNVLPYSDMFFLHTYMDYAPEGVSESPEDYYGIYDFNLEPKPVFYVYKYFVPWSSAWLLMVLAGGGAFLYWLTRKR